MYDVIVIGLQPTGMAALFQLSKAGLNVLGIDNNAVLTSQEMRKAIGGGLEYVPLAVRSREIHHEIARLIKCGFDIKGAAQIITAQANLSRWYGATIVKEEQVIAVHSDSRVEKVTTNKGSYYAKKVIVTLEEQIHVLLPELDPVLKAYYNDDKFIIDFHPLRQNIIITSTCANHGFRYFAAIGEVLMQLATKGESDIDISFFSFARFVETLDIVDQAKSLNRITSKL